MTSVKCPYCEHDQEICHDDGYGMEEDELHEQECDKCKKSFAYHTSIILYYEAYKADCLNGGEHKFKPVVHFPADLYPNWMRCSDCGIDNKGQIRADTLKELFPNDLKGIL